MSAESEALSGKELEELKDKAAKADEYWDRILRLNAEFENSKKRLEKRSQDSVRFANEKLLLDLVPLVDDLDRAITSLDSGHDLKPIREGLHLAQNQFHKVLEQNGVEVIQSLGKRFDPNLHEAVGEIETAEVPEGHVAEELQRGYLLNGRLARPSRVRIAKKKN